LVGGNREKTPPAIDESMELPHCLIDINNRVVTLKYAAADLPFGVARVVVGPKEKPLGSALVIFRARPRGDQTVYVADIRFDALNLPADRRISEQIYALPATEENRAEFGVDEVRALRGACNGARSLREQVDQLLAWVESAK
jgi:hypothetical protein